MTDLEKYFRSNQSNMIDKWLHYFEIYDRYFHKYRNKEVVILEIGVFQGGSLKMWQDYFGDKLKLYAIDINPSCKRFESDKVKIFIGSQEDRSFLQSVKQQIPKLDILIDDGGHFMNQQIVSFEELYGHIKGDGIYLCEDLHTSYWKKYGGGYKGSGSFIEYTKNFIDYVNAWHSQEAGLSVNEFTKSTFGVHYYDSIVVLEKREMKPPVSERTGVASISNEEFYRQEVQTIAQNSQSKNRFLEKFTTLLKSK